MSSSTIRAQLLRKRNAIFSRANRLNRHIGAPIESYEVGVDADIDEDGEELTLKLESLDSLFQIDGASRAELRAINNSLERIEAGVYGICSNCRQAIDIERRLALPYTEVCVDCAAVVPSVRAG